MKSITLEKIGLGNADLAAIGKLSDPSSSKAIPEVVLTKRAEARELINTLEVELVTIGGN